MLGRSFFVIALLFLSGAVLLAPLAQAEPTGGQISAGTGAIVQAGTTTTITQSSQNLAINWQNFSIGSNEAVRFNQPNAASIALNRVTGQNPSQILGSLSANGQVFVLNPNGVLFGASAQVDVGGLVASTLSMSNADFMAGNYQFNNGGKAGSVVNQGTLNAANGGYIALLAPEVRNEGVITATLGTAVLAAGDKVTLNINNGSLMSYSIDQGSLNALAENKQLIVADGGQVFMSAKAADALSTAVVNNTGIIEARTLQNHNGIISLLGDMQVGQVNVGGTLDASAPNGGNGGFIETSAAHVKVATDAKITTQASQGISGNWLIDPPDFTIAATGGDITGTTLSTNLATTSVTILSSQGTVNLLGNGDIFVNDVVSWNSANSLTLNAIRNINVNSAITNAGTGAINLIAAAAVAVNANISAAGTISITAPTGFTQAVATTITTGTGLTVDVPAASALSGVIAGTGGLTKNGIGILTLSGINTYTGATMVNAGGLTLSGTGGSAVSSAFTVNLGSKLTLDNTTANTTTIGGRISDTLALTLNGGELVFNGTNVAATAASETIGALTLASGASTITLNSGTGGSTILTAASIARSPSAGATVLFRGTNLGNAPLAGVTNIMFTTAPTVAAGSFVGGGVGGLGTSQFDKGIVPFAIGDTTATGAGIGFVTYNINPTSNVANTTGIRPLSAGEYTTSTVTAGVNLKVSAAQSPNISIAFNSIFLELGSTYTVGSAGAGKTLTIISGAVFSASGTANTITAKNSDALAFGAEANIFTVGGLTISGLPTSGTAGLTKAGTGTLTLSRTNTYTGTTTVNAGILAYGAINALPTTGAVTVNGGTLDMGTFTGTTGAVTLTNGSITGTTGVLTGTGYTVSNGTISAILAGAVPLTKTTTGKVTLSGVNTYTGATAINAGTLSVNGTAIADTSAITVATGATLALTGSETIGSLAGAGNVTLGAFTLAAGGDNTSTTFSGVASGTGGLTKLGTGIWTLSGLNTYTGITTINTGILSVATIGLGGIAGNLGAATNLASNLVLSGGTLQYTGVTATTDRAYTLTAASTSSIDVSVAGTTLTMSGTGAATTGALTKLGAGTLTLTGTNLYTGATTINAGTLSVNGTAIADTSAVTVATGATLALTGNEAIGSLAGAGNVTLGAFTLTAGGDNTTTTYSGLASGTGGLTKAGTGIWTLSGANTYSGVTTVSASTLKLGNTSALGTSSSVSVTAGATLDLNGITLLTAIPLTLNGTGVGGTAGALTNSALTTATYSGAITLGSDSNILAGTGLTLSSTGTINGAFALNVLGGGTVTLGGAIGNITPLASFTGAAGTALNINSGVVNTSGAQIYSGTTTFGAATTLTAGSISTTGAVTAIVGTLTLSTGAGNATLTNAANNIGTVKVTSGANISVTNSVALTVAGISATGLVDVHTQTGNLTLTTAAIATTSTSANAVTLVADVAAIPNATGSGGNFINTGNVAITTGAGGAWRIYTGNPTGTVRGGLVEAAKRYNVDDASDPLLTGNRLYFRIQPTLTITTVSTSKTYNGAGADPAFTYSTSGLLRAIPPAY